MMGYQTEEPWNEPTVRKRVRLLGLAMFCFVILYASALPFIIMGIKS